MVKGRILASQSVRHVLTAVSLTKVSASHIRPWLLGLLCLRAAAMRPMPQVPVPRGHVRGLIMARRNRSEPGRSVCYLQRGERRALSLLCWLVALICLCSHPAAAAPVSFTVNVSEPVTVTGTPRIAINVGGVTRYADFVSSAGSAMTFTYQVLAGDFDPDGISFDTPQIDLNGATITDLAGNPLSGLSFTAPNTSGLKVQTYTVAFTSTANPAAISFTIAKAPLNAGFSYTISSTGGTGTVTGSGTITASPQTLSGVDVSALAAGTLTLSITISNASGTGAPRTASVTPTLSAALDSLPTAQLIYSLRRLRSAYTGPLLRVRRAADDAERDIAATLAGDLDTTTLATFCGTDSCVVPLWYDQSGNAIDAVPGGSLPPRIVNAGTVEREGQKPALRYTSLSQLLMTNVGLSVQTVDATWNAVARVADTSANRHIMGNRCGGSTGRIMRALSGGGYVIGTIGSGGSSMTLSGSTTQQRIITAIMGASTALGALDGVVTAGTAGSFYGFSDCQLEVGGGGAGQNLGSGSWIGTIAEVTLFNTALSTSDRQTLERNQGSYFGISVP